MSVAFIPCEDFYEEDVGTIPGRLKCTDPGCLKDRWGNFIYNMDLSPLPGDEALGNQRGAWSIWDIPTSLSAQIEDQIGNDLITVAVQNRIYALDYTRFRDEWEPNTFAPIYRMIKFGPVPYNLADTEGRGGYALNVLKRFREIQFSLKNAPTQGPEAVWRISVGETEREQETWRIGVRQTAQLMRALIAVKGRSFTVRLENASNDPVQINSWFATWDVLGKRLPANKRSK
jgi:hypothetical protein